MNICIYLYDPMKQRLEHQRKVQQKEEGCHAVVPLKSCGSTTSAVVPPTVLGIEQKEEGQAAQAVEPLLSTACPVLPGNPMR